MNDTIICPYCQKSIPLTQALSSKIEEKYQKFYKQRLDEEKQKMALQLKTDLEKKVKEQMELQLKDKLNEAQELRAQNKNLQEQLLQLNKLVRHLRYEKEEERIEFEKRLAQKEEEIRLAEQKRIEEKYRLKILEKDKQLNDALRAADEYRRKLEQGSQQLQGEIQELELENILKKEFPFDEIREVPKGVSGADILQVVKNNYGKICGNIIWESKRTKNWSDNWISKLKEDQRRAKAEVAVIITQVLPNGVKNFTFKDGVWVGDFSSVVGLALILRSSLIEIFQVKSSLIGKEEKKEILWNYLTSTEFRQRIEAVYDAYSALMEDLKKEKDYFRKKWAKQEKNIEGVAENILGIHGDLQGIVGKSLPEIKAMESLPTPAEKDKLF